MFVDTSWNICCICGSSTLNNRLLRKTLRSSSTFLDNKFMKNNNKKGNGNYHLQQRHDGNRYMNSFRCSINYYFSRCQCTMYFLIQRRYVSLQIENRNQSKRKKRRSSSRRRQSMSHYGFKPTCSRKFLLVQRKSLNSHNLKIEVRLSKKRQYHCDGVQSTD